MAEVCYIYYIVCIYAVLLYSIIYYYYAAVNIYFRIFSTVWYIRLVYNAMFFYIDYTILV